MREFLGIVFISSAAVGCVAAWGTSPPSTTSARGNPPSSTRSAEATRPSAKRGDEPSNTQIAEVPPSAKSAGATLPSAHISIGGGPSGSQIGEGTLSPLGGVRLYRDDAGVDPTAGETEVMLSWKEGVGSITIDGDPTIDKIDLTTCKAFGLAGDCVLVVAHAAYAKTKFDAVLACGKTGGKVSCLRAGSHDKTGCKAPGNAFPLTAKNGKLVVPACDKDVRAGEYSLPF